MNFFSSFAPKPKFVTALFVWIAVVFAAALLDWYFITLLDRSSSALLESKKRVGLLETERRLLSSEKEYLFQKDAVLRRIEGVFVNSENPLAFIEKLESSASLNRMALKLSPPQARGGTLYMRVEAEGQLSDALSFLRALENFSEQVIAEEVILERLEEGVKPARGRVPASRARITSNIEFLAT